MPVLTFEEVFVWAECQHWQTGCNCPQGDNTHQPKHCTQQHGHTGGSDDITT